MYTQRNIQARWSTIVVVEKKRITYSECVSVA